MLSDVSLNNSVFIVSFGAAVAAEQTRALKNFFLCIAVFPSRFSVRSFSPPPSTLSLVACMRCLWSSKSENTKKVFSLFWFFTADKNEWCKSCRAHNFASLFFAYLLLCCYSDVHLECEEQYGVGEKWDDKNRKKKVHPQKKCGGEGRWRKNETMHG